MKVGLFGGSFNPIHTGHLIVIDQAIERLGFDKFIVMPAACNPLKMKDADMASPDDRLAMARIATSDLRNIYPWLEVSDMEINRGAPSYTIDTVLALKSDDITLVIGEDSWRTLWKWHRIDEIVDLVKFAVATRNVLDTPKTIGSKFNWQQELYRRVKTTTIDIPTFDTSGTEVRGRIREGRSVRYLIPDAVTEYIRERGMYLTK